MLAANDKSLSDVQKIGVMLFPLFVILTLSNWSGIMSHWLCPLSRKPNDKTVDSQIHIRKIILEYLYN